MKTEVREETLTRQVQAARQRLDELYRRAGTSAQQGLLDEALEELSVALEELRVTTEEMRQSHEELAASRHQVEAERRYYEELFESAPDGYLVTDGEGTIQEANRAAARMLRVRQDFLVGKPLLLFIPEPEHKSFFELLTRLEQVEAVLSGEMEMRPRDGEPFPASLKVSVVRESPATGRPAGLRWLVRDITGRKQAQEALRESETRFKMIMDNCPTMIFLKDLEGRYVYCNPQFEKVTRESNSKIIGKTDFEIFPEKQAAVFRANDLKVIEARIPLEFEEVALHADGPHTSIVCNFPLFAAAGNIYAICGIVTDITERKCAEERIRSQAAELKRMHDDLELRVRERTSELAKVNEELRNEVAERRRVEEALRESEEKFRNLAKQLEDQLIISDRLVSFGELAASIAHEFNNPLQIILGFTQDLLSEMRPSQPESETLKIVEKETLRCKEIIKNLLDFARPAAANLVLLTVDSVVHDSIRLVLSYLEKSKIQVEIDMRSNPPKIHGDPQQLQQVLINLFFNAAEAMPRGGALTIRVTAPASVRHDGDNAEDRGELTIAVSDTGIGIEPESMPNIFRPFFSTKKRKGMGLGLSICERIMRVHGGRISVESRRGIGTTFYLHFPLAEA